VPVANLAPTKLATETPEAAWGRDYVTPQWGRTAARLTKTAVGFRGAISGGQVAGVTDTHGDSRVPEALNRAISTIMPFTGGKS
jgi:hypothetical protein